MSLSGRGFADVVDCGVRSPRTDIITLEDKLAIDVGGAHGSDIRGNSHSGGIAASSWPGVDIIVTVALRRWLNG